MPCESDDRAGTRHDRPPEPQGRQIQDEMAETTKEWPHVFAKLPFDHQIFLDKFDANHCHAVYGNKVEELKMISEMLDIDVEILGEEE